MSDILLVKKSTEIRTVEVPDYSAELRNIERLKERKIESEKIKNTTVQLLANSIVEQIATYLYEIYNPILNYAIDKNICPTQIGTYCGKWHIRICGSGDTLNIKLSYQNSCCSAYEPLISIYKDYYKIENNNHINPSNIQELIKYWSSLKTNINNSINYTLRHLKEEETTEYNSNLKMVESFTNFEL